MRSSHRLLAVAVILSLPVVAHAQTGPRAGSWGAEVEIGANARGNLLHFSAPETATLYGGSVSIANVDVSGGASTTSTALELRIGRRGYRQTAQSLRPFRTFGGLLGFTSNGIDSWIVGGFADFGTAYFFSPRVSLGAAAEVRLTYQHVDGGVGGADVNTLGISASVVKVLGAVYF